MWAVQDEIAGRIAAVFHLSPADTRFTSADGPAVFGSADGRTQFLTEVHDLSPKPKCMRTQMSCVERPCRQKGCTYTHTNRNAATSRHCLAGVWREAGLASPVDGPADCRSGQCQAHAPFNTSMQLFVQRRMGPTGCMLNDMLQGPLLAGGRVNVFMRSSGTYVPNLDIELYHYGLSNKLFVYINLVPRRSLVRVP